MASRMDWKLCIICQESTKELLKCPYAHTTGDKSKAYENFLTSVSEFRELNKLPVAVVFEKDMDTNRLTINQAKWHKPCYLKFNDSKLQKARKREHNDNITEESSLPKRSRLQRQPLEKSKCIFCEGGGQLNEFRTLDADSNVRKMSTDLQDIALLTRIEGSDLTTQESKYHLTCLTGIRNKQRSFIRQSQGCHNSSREDNMTQAKVFVELLTYIDNCRKRWYLHLVFKTSSDVRAQITKSRL